MSDKKASNSLRKRISNFRRLRSVLSIKHAFKIAFGSFRPEQEESFFSPMLGRNVILRPGATDVSVLKKVFSNDEYRLPFPIKPRVIVDAGANIGMASLYFWKQFPSARIIAIEPEASNFAVLKQNCAGIVQIELHNSALWNRPANLVLKDADAEKWAFAYKDADDSVPTATSTITIPQILDSVGGKIDLLKLDIESAELELFGEEAESWLPHVRMIAIELHDRFRPGCSRAFYRQVCRFEFEQAVIGENVFILFPAFSSQ